MDYYDGNTVTGLWNYAQNYAMSDNNYDTVFGPSTPGALNLISGQTGGSYAVRPHRHHMKVARRPGHGQRAEQRGPRHDLRRPRPRLRRLLDNSHTNLPPNPGSESRPARTSVTCSTPRASPGAGSRAGSRPPGPPRQRRRLRGLRRHHKNIGGNTVTDYSPHHEPFQYYKSTANPKHLPPSSEATIGHTDQANHQYDISNFYTTLTDGNMPAVSFLKAPADQDGHPGYSDPLDEQTFLVNTINKIQQSRYWASTAIVITYDDSDGWYDHQPPVIVNGSNTAADTAICSSAPMTLGNFPDRCGFSRGCRCW